MLSEHPKNLEGHVKERYVQKLSVVGVDPVSLPSEHMNVVPRSTMNTNGETEN